MQLRKAEDRALEEFRVLVAMLVPFLVEQGIGETVICGEVNDFRAELLKAECRLLCRHMGQGQKYKIRLFSDGFRVEGLADQFR